MELLACRPIAIPLDTTCVFKKKITQFPSLEPSNNTCLTIYAKRYVK